MGSFRLRATQAAGLLSGMVVMGWSRPVWPSRVVGERCLHRGLAGVGEGEYLLVQLADQVGAPDVQGQDIAEVLRDARRSRGGAQFHDFVVDLGGRPHQNRAAISFAGAGHGRHDCITHGL